MDFSKADADTNAEHIGSFLHFPHIGISETGEFPNGLLDIQLGEVHGFLIRDVLSPEEADKLVAYFNSLDNADFEHNRNGRNIPKPFASVVSAKGSSSNPDPYFLKAHDFWNGFPERCGFDIVDRLKSVFKMLSGGRRVEVPVERTHQMMFSPAQMREMYVDRDGIYVHCGKYFRDRFATFYSHMEDFSAIDEQISYFIMLQPPDEGGELTVYDMYYNDVKRKEEEWDNKTVIADDGSRIDLENADGVKRRKICPRKGDMIIFDGGNVWHRVENPVGHDSRITIGGFVTFSHDNSTVHFWG